MQKGTAGTHPTGEKCRQALKGHTQSLKAIQVAPASNALWDILSKATSEFNDFLHRKWPSQGHNDWGLDGSGGPVKHGHFNTHRQNLGECECF